MTQVPSLPPLTEYAPARFARQAIPHELGVALWRDYGQQVAVEFPSPKTDDQWQLTSQGWVGCIPLAPEWVIRLEPKVELGNLFGMLEYAYRLKSFRFLEGLVACQSLEEFYERLANVLSRRILDRGRKGFYRAYLPVAEQLPYVRGRLDVRRTIRTPWNTHLDCRYEEHTPDLVENQLLAWTLLRIAHSGMCSERVLPTVRRAYRALRGLVSVQPFRAQDCLGRLYNRLNDDYQPLHALCRFFLEHSGPSHEVGDRSVLPFLVNMARLYELFVAEWLKAHLPGHLMLKAQENVEIGEGERLRFTIDLVLYDADTGEACCVLDTKYKASSSPAHEDINQVVAYAEMMGCRRAVLIYPSPLSSPWNATVGQIRVQSGVFALEGDLEQAGWGFLRWLLGDGLGGESAFRQVADGSQGRSTGA